MMVSDSLQWGAFQVGKAIKKAIEILGLLVKIMEMGNTMVYLYDSLLKPPLYVFNVKLNYVKIIDGITR